MVVLVSGRCFVAFVSWVLAVGLEEMEMERVDEWRMRDAVSILVSINATLFLSPPASAHQ